MNKKLRPENEARNLEQMMNDLRVTAYTEGYRAGYDSACRWNDIGWANVEGPLPVDDDEETSDDHLDEADYDYPENEPENPFEDVFEG